MQIIKQSTDRLNKFFIYNVDYFDKVKHWSDFKDLVTKPVKDKIKFNDTAIQEIHLLLKMKLNKLYQKLLNF